MANLQTQLAQMIDPEVMATMLNAQLPKQIRFSSIAPVDPTLPGQATMVQQFYQVQCGDFRLDLQLFSTLSGVIVNKKEADEKTEFSLSPAAPIVPLIIFVVEPALKAGRPTQPGLQFPNDNNGQAYQLPVIVNKK